MERAAEIIAERGPSALMPFDLTVGDVDGMDMICGGRAELFLDHLLPTEENTDLFKQWDLLTAKRRSGAFVTAVTTAKDRVDRVCRAVMVDGEVAAGDLSLPPAALAAVAREARRARSLKTLALGDALVIIEPSAGHHGAFLFGAGHVAQPTSHLCALVGFDVTVLDDRASFASADRFPGARQVRVLESFDDAFSGLRVERNAFIVIFTRGHRHDQTVLHQALKTRAGYIGMIGSRRKRDAVFEALRKAGHSRQAIERVRSPIGLAIGAKSPEEIAVSIVAEMIQERARMAG
jgi:xanthine dehydrogenase accessory factor